MEEQSAQSNNQAFHKFEEKNKKNPPMGAILFLIFTIVVGASVGYLVFKMTTGSASQVMSSTTGSKTAVSKGMVFGASNLSSFPDSAEGVLQKGGINNEGQYHLVRSGGPSQYVYLTSSSVDLSMFINHKVKVNGATQKAQTAGWLMDVGRVEVEN